MNILQQRAVYIDTDYKKHLRNFQQDLLNRPLGPPNSRSARTQVKFTAGVGSVQKALFEISWTKNIYIYNIYIYVFIICMIYVLYIYIIISYSINIYIYIHHNLHSDCLNQLSHPPRPGAGGCICKLHCGRCASCGRCQSRRHGKSGQDFT